MIMPASRGDYLRAAKQMRYWGRHNGEVALDIGEGDRDHDPDGDEGKYIVRRWRPKR
jgi:hypothetical protein